MERQQEPVQNHSAQDISPEPVSTKENQGVIDFDYDSNNYDRPVALRKWKRTCTQHPICNFVYFELLSPTYCVFVSNIGKVQASSSIEEAFKDLKWKTTTFEEIKAFALEKNNTWQIT